VVLPLFDWLITNLVVPPGAKQNEIDIPFEYKGMWEGVLKFFGVDNAMHLPATMLSGIKTNFKMSDLGGLGSGTLQAIYAHKTTLEDFQLPRAAGDSAVLVCARQMGADELLLAAIGRLDVIRGKKALNSTKLHNGVHWYCTASKSIGFAPDATVNQQNADNHDKASQCRLS